MARTSLAPSSVDTRVADAGAFEVDKNISTIGGYACLAAGSALALGVGAAVAPAPVLGLTALGGGLVVAGNIESVKEVFAKAKTTAPTIGSERTSDSSIATDGGKYATAAEMGNEAVPVATQAAITVNA